MIDVPRVLAIGLRDLSWAVIVERVGGRLDSQFSLFFTHFRAFARIEDLKTMDFCGEPLSRLLIPLEMGR